MIEHASFEALVDPRARVEYCLRDLRFFAGDTGYLAKRSFTAASRLCGTSTKFLRTLARRAAPPHSISSALDRRESKGGGYDFVCPLPREEFGFVYRARLQDYPRVIKIGFSKTPESRMAQLRYQTGHEHVLISAVEGCLFDESRHFLANCWRHIGNEWFWDGAGLPEDLPAFLKGGFDTSSWCQALAGIGEYEYSRDAGLSALASLYIHTAFGARYYPCRAVMGVK